MPKIFCPQESRVKLWIVFKDGSKKPIYSILKEDKKGVLFSMFAMKRRLLEGKYFGQFKLAIFYDNTTGKQIEKVDQDGYFV